MRYNQKRARKSSKRAQLWIFTPYFSKFRVFRTLHTPKQHVFLELLVENKTFYFSKKALLAGTTCKKWLKQALMVLDTTILNNSSSAKRDYECQVLLSQILFAFRQKYN